MASNLLISNVSLDGSSVVVKEGTLYTAPITTVSHRLKQPVRAASSANGTLASDFANGDSVGGVTVSTGDRILIKNQTDPIENGIYIVTADTPTRATDLPAATTAAQAHGVSVLVTAGTSAGKVFVLTAATGAVGTGELTFAESSVSASSLACDNLTKGDNNVSLNTSSGNILIDAEAGGVTIDAGSGTILLDATGNVEINSSAGSLSFGADSASGDVSIGTGGSRTITVGNNTSGKGISLGGGEYVFGIESTGESNDVHTFTIADNATYTAIAEVVAYNLTNTRYSYFKVTTLVSKTSGTAAPIGTDETQTRGTITDMTCAWSLASNNLVFTASGTNCTFKGTIRILTTSGTAPTRAFT